MDLGGVSVIVLNWRTPEYTIRAVRALVTDGVPAERVLVVDNASGDDSVEQIRAALPGVGLLATDENLGFARANNLAARTLAADRAYLFVNSDAFVHLPGSVSRLGRALDNPAVGIAVPRLRNADLTVQPTVAPFSTPLPELVRASGVSRLVPNDLQPRLATHWDHGRSRTIQAAIGPVLMVSADLWRDVGGFTERHFMYAEDLDLFWQAAQRGWAARFVAEAEFVHLGGASVLKRWDDAQRAERVARAEVEMLREHLGPARSRLTILIMAAGVGARALHHRLRGDRAAAEIQLGWMRGYLSRPERIEAPPA
jgi:N-acetylglucosaminyl-diphospho-decaprenol L-rhamnosyltransferase